ncbi:MAG: DNA-directed RNA polymerase subunit omega [Lachnospiraceae bacterium]|nr:DNA-directed RNA polymerase subunit omega [Lachnospiraceae bacterium]
MLRPSYNQLIQKANENFETEEPIVRSRYSIVLAAAKRARQIVDGNVPYVNGDVRKPLSVAVAELNEGKVQILPAGGVPETVIEEAQEVAEAAGEAVTTDEAVAAESVTAEEAVLVEPTEEIEL